MLPRTPVPGSTLLGGVQGLKIEFRVGLGAFELASTGSVQTVVRVGSW